MILVGKIKRHSKVFWTVYIQVTGKVRQLAGFKGCKIKRLALMHE